MQIICYKFELKKCICYIGELPEPSKAWLDGNGDAKELLTAIEQAERDCGSCVCEYDPLYKKQLNC